jgi:hypothetical protein
MSKKKWTKPECTQIKLVPEEAVLAGCKTNGAAGPGFTGANCKEQRNTPCSAPTS